MRRIRRLFRLRAESAAEVRQQVDEEIELHLALRAERLRAAGLTEAEARAEAARRFGSLERARERLREDALWRERRQGLRERLEGWWEDARHAGRTLWTDRAVSAVVIVTLALGIGANAVMFGIADRLLVRGPAHVLDADQVGRLYLTREIPGRGMMTTGITGYVMYALMRDARAFESVAAYKVQSATVGEPPAARRIPIGYATWDLFALLGVRPAFGRFFGAEEDRPPQGAPVAVVSWEYWRGQLGADPGVIGREVTVQDTRHTVVGVLPQGFTGPELGTVDLWLPMSTLPPPRPDWPTTWRAQWLSVVGRLKPGITAEAASEEATARFRVAFAEQEDPAIARNGRVDVLPLRYSLAGREPVEMAVTRWLVGVSLIVLLVACANVANLLLAAAIRRRREMAVRLALGAGRARVLRLLLFRSLVLGLVGGAAALLIAALAAPVIRALLLPAVQWETPVDGRVLLFSAIVALITGLVIGIAPVLDAGRRDLTAAMKSGVREGGVARSRLRVTLTVAQAALSVVLLVGAGLFVRSLWQIRGLDLGIQPDRVVVAEVVWGSSPQDPAARSAERARRADVYRRALERVRSRPDVEAATLSIGTPFGSSFGVGLRVPGHDSIPRLPGGGPYISAVTSDYFATVGTDLVAGRTFTEADRKGSAPVVIVNRTMAETLWPGANALGRCLLIGDIEAPPCAEVVGIVEEAKRDGLRDPPAMQYYIPFGQEVGFGGTALMVRPTGDTGPMRDILRAELYDLATGAGFVWVQTLQDALDPQIRPWRLGATMFTLFGGLALVIAAVGLSSLVAIGVAHRRGEIGIRIALGARTRNILSLVVRQALTLVLAGLAIGLLLSVAGAPFIAPLLFDTSPRDTVTLAAVTVALVVAAVLAALIPARRAARTPPVEALRVD